MLNDAERTQIELLRSLTPTQRVGIALDLSEAIRQLSLRALRNRMPEATEREVGIAFIRLHYGDDLANEVAAYWSDKDSRRDVS